ncbi:MAG: NUDIX hydrolase [Elusimicrobia bacterium RIFOXYB2_FULL_62_6]|nr:MAG: NUDIX hydrolase [Elusimicrobia bacterium RIFOXYB2_FULL_62_6]
MRQVSAAVIRKNGRILIARRKAGDALAGKWEFPGGKLEPGETPEDCLKRELTEEFGIETEIGKFICSSKFEYKHLAMELLVYSVSHIAGDFIPADHDKIEWVRPEDLGDYDFAGADIPVVKLLQSEAA